MAQQPSGDEPEKGIEAEGADAPAPKTSGEPPADAGEEGTDTEEERDEEEEVDDPTHVQIPVRSSYTASQVIARQKRTIAKLKEKTSETGDEPVEEEGSEEELSPEAARAISRRVSDAIGPVKKLLIEKADEGELQQLFTDIPDSKKFEKRIKAFMAHDAYSAVPAKMIYHHLAFEAAKKIAATKRTNADREAGHSRAGGHAPRQRSPSDKLTPENISDMTDQEFQALQHKVQTGQLT